MKKITLLVTALLLIACLLSTGLAAPRIVSPEKDFYYYDDAGVLTDETMAYIYYNNVNLEKACGAQIVVVVVNTLNGLDEENYAYRLINDWGVGDKDERNGIVILLAIKEDTYFVSVGEGIERFLTVNSIYDINNTYLEPDFARKKYDAGVTKVFRAYFEEVCDHYHLNLSLTDGKTLLNQHTDFTPAKGGGSDLMDIIIGIIVVIVILSIVRSALRRPRGPRAARSSRVVVVPPIIRAPRPPRPPRVGGFGGPRPGPGPHPGSPFGGSSRPSGGLGSSRPSGGFGGSRPSGGFGGARGGGGGGRGAGAGRGR